MRNLIVATVATACALIAGAATAQNTNADPNYGEVTLSAGFTPDPAMLRLQAGGSIDASDRFDGCRGFISATPDVRLFWDGSAKSALTLKFSALSNADTTLIVNDPNGRWHCDDDSGEDSNPLVELSPIPGRYEIWIGTYSEGETKNAVLSISELYSF
jgi:hypothetical protein